MNEWEREIILSASEVKYDLWDQKYYISCDTCETWVAILDVQELHQWMLQSVENQAQPNLVCEHTSRV